MAAPSALTPTLGLINGTVLSDGKIQVSDWDAHEGTIGIGGSWGFREGTGGMGIAVPSRGGSVQLTAIELKANAPIEDDSLMLNVYDENDGSLLAIVDVDLDLAAGAPGTRYTLPTPIDVPPGINLGFRFTSGRTNTHYPESILGIYLSPSVDPGLPTVPGDPRLVALNAREDDSFGIWGATVGELTVDSVFAARHNPRVDLGLDGGDTTVMEVWAVGMRAGRGDSTSRATIGIRNHADDYNLGTFDAVGPRWAQMLATPFTYPSGASLGFTCESTSGTPLKDVVAIVWVREIVIQLNGVYVADPDHDLYIAGDVYTSP